MNSVWERAAGLSDEDADRALAPLKSGGSPSRAVTEGGGDSLDVIAALARVGLGEGEGLPLVQSSPTRPWLAPSLSEAAWAGLLPRAKRTGRLALAAALFQIHDFWELSHEAAQEADDLGERAVSAYWHGIAHRREPDPGNASYWFRRVGRHALFRPLAEAARPLLDAHGDPGLTARLVSAGTWNPSAFIDLCGGAGRGSAIELLARKLQRLEMVLLLDATVEVLND